MSVPGRGPVTATVLAPAKLNLGLEVIRRRADGYHDIATVVRTIGIYDEVTVIARDEPRITLDVLGLPIPTTEGDGPGPNLAVLAAEAMLAARPLEHGLAIHLTKGIPAAAGLGGASSDAAAVLRAVNALMPDPVGEDTLHGLALDIGSDVPLFLRGGCVLLSGRGDQVEPVATVEDATYVVVMPVLSRTLARKTPALYAALRPGDFSGGDRVGALASDLRAGRWPDPAGYANAFRRPLLDLWPELDRLEAALRQTALAVAFSGAGPSLYGVFADRQSAERARAQVLGTIEPAPWVVVAGPVPLPPMSIPAGQDPAARWTRKPQAP